MTTDKTEASSSPESQPAVGSQVDRVVRPAPVAWKFMQATYGDGDLRGRGWLPTLKFTEPRWATMQKDVQPLYDQAALDAAVAAERERCAKKPLTAQQLDKLIEAHVGGGEIDDNEYYAMVLFAAAVERAHGIGA